MSRSLLDTFWASLVTHLRWFLALIQSWIRRSTGPVITLDTGRRVRMERQLAEGGFSFVFLACDTETATHKYALKRISCPDPDILRACHEEAGVHRAVRHPNLMPLLGMTVVENNTICYMLFPYLPRSLRTEVNSKLLDPPELKGSPWSEVTVLQLFYRILLGVQALHDKAHVSHRDIKLENILLRNHRHILQPVLMDFGSAGPLSQPIDSRRQVLHIIEEASIHTTMPYRPPELFEGGIRAGDDPVDFTRVDVWSLGCTLFAMLFGASPFECEFPRANPEGRVIIVECTHLSVLKSLPWPPEHTTAAHWYSNDVHNLLITILEPDRRKRPSLVNVMSQVKGLIEKHGAQVDDGNRSALHIDNNEETIDSDQIALMSNRV